MYVYGRERGRIVDKRFSAAKLQNRLKKSEFSDMTTLVDINTSSKMDGWMDGWMGPTEMKQHDGAIERWLEAQNRGKRLLVLVPHTTLKLNTIFS